MKIIFSHPTEEEKNVPKRYDFQQIVLNIRMCTEQNSLKRAKVAQYLLTLKMSAKSMTQRYRIAVKYTVLS